MVRGGRQLAGASRSVLALAHRSRLMDAASCGAHMQTTRCLATSAAARANALTATGESLSAVTKSLLVDTLDLVRSHVLSRMLEQLDQQTRLYLP